MKRDQIANQKGDFLKMRESPFLIMIYQNEIIKMEWFNSLLNCKYWWFWESLFDLSARKFQWVVRIKWMLSKRKGG